MDTERTTTIFSNEFDRIDELINELKAKADRLKKLADDARDIAEEAMSEYRKAHKEYMLSCLPSDFPYYNGCMFLYEETYKTTNGFTMKKYANVMVIDVDNKDDVAEYPVYVTVKVLDTDNEFTFRVDKNGKPMYNNIRLESRIDDSKKYETH